MHAFTAVEIVAGLFSGFLVGWIAGFIWLQFDKFIRKIQSAG